jgi:hypothetical protein
MPVLEFRAIVRAADTDVPEVDPCENTAADDGQGGKELYSGYLDRGRSQRVKGHAVGEGHPRREWEEAAKACRRGMTRGRQSPAVVCHARSEPGHAEGARGAKEGTGSAFERRKLKRDTGMRRGRRDVNESGRSHGRGTGAPVEMNGNGIGHVDPLVIVHVEACLPASVRRDGVPALADAIRIAQPDGAVLIDVSPEHRDASGGYGLPRHDLDGHVSAQVAAVCDPQAMGARREAGKLKVARARRRR